MLWLFLLKISCLSNDIPRPRKLHIALDPASKLHRHVSTLISILPRDIAVQVQRSHVCVILRELVGSLLTSWVHCRAKSQSSPALPVS